MFNKTKVIMAFAVITVVAAAIIFFAGSSISDLINPPVPEPFAINDPTQEQEEEELDEPEFSDRYEMPPSPSCTYG